MINKIVYVLLVCIVFFFAGCLKSKFNSQDTQNVTLSRSVQTIDEIKDFVKQNSVQTIVEQANRWRDTYPDLTSIITDKEILFVFPNKQEIKKKIPQDLFFVSIAPFVDFTHECYNHVFSSCTGEIFEEEIFVNAVNSNGKVLINEAIQTRKNGFIDLWLPRNDEITFTLTYKNLEAKEIIKTSAKERTCITTMQLI